MPGSSPKKHAAAPAPVAAAYKAKHEQVLRIAASDVAAVAGYHEWVDIRDLFLERLLYQDLEHLLRIDAANVGMEIEDRQQRSERLLAKAGNGELRAVQKKAGDGAAVATVQDAQALRDKARSLLKDAEGKKKLSKQEAKELENDLRHDINTRFGTRNENYALDVYERRSGTEVICSNERFLVWPFPGSKISGDEVPEGPLDPPVELSKGWTKADSRQSSEPQSAEAEFASATASCLAQLAARKSLERVGNGRLAPSSTAGGDASGVRQRENGGGVSTITTIDGVREINGADGGDGGTMEMVVDADSRGGSGVAADAMKNGVKRAGEGRGSENGPPFSGADQLPSVQRPPPPPPTAPVPEDSPATSSGSKRELVPGVPWPEWRGSIPRGPDAGETSPTTSLETSQPGGVTPGKHANPADDVPSAVPSEGWTGEHGGLWFPSCLTSRQRRVAHAAAEELGLRHESVAGEAGARHVVVWEPSPVVSSSPSESKVAAESTASAVVPSNGSNTRRASSIPVQATGAASSSKMDTKPNGEHSVTSGGNVSSASSIPTAYTRGRRLSRRGRLAMAAELEAQPTSSVQPGASAAEHKGAPAPLSNGRATTTACKVGTPAGNAGDKGGAAVVATSKPARRVSFCVEEFGGDPVYAWGEGPSATATGAVSAAAAEPAPFAAREDAEELADGQEWSVWSRNSQPSSPSAPGTEGWTNGANGANGAAGGTEETSPVAPGDREGRAETLRERRKNACFVVVGAVDGVAEEVTDAPEDADTWETRRVVVEVKNRMNMAKDPPPLYDQIQLVTYMLMVGAPVGDLVQLVKTGASRRNGKEGAPTQKRPAMEDDGVLVSRVELDCRTYRHRKHWKENILPRLYSFARMVYRFRGDDLLRWRYLLATPEEQREMLVECCPYLDSVISSTPVTASRATPAANSVNQASPQSEVIDLRGDGGDGTGKGPLVRSSGTEPVGTPGPNVEEAVRAVQAESNGCDGGALESKSGVSVGTGGSGSGDGGDSCVRPDDTVARGDREDDGADHGERSQEDDASVTNTNLAKEISGVGSTVTVLSQRTRRGESFIEPLGDAATSSMDTASVTSPVRKKSKSEDGSAVNQPDHTDARKV